MNEIIQWIIVGLIVVASAIFLVVKLTKTKESGSCSGCSDCKHGVEYAAKCKDNIDKPSSTTKGGDEF